MSRRLLVLLVAIAVLGSAATRIRKSRENIARELYRHDRFVDMGVLLRVVRMDIEHGQPLLGADMPSLRVLREHKRGCIVDTFRTRKRPNVRRHGDTKDPAIWYCSEDQEPLILHGPSIRPRVIAYGSEGGGKTAALVRWHFLRVLERLGRNLEGGQTAPTTARLLRFHEEAEVAWRGQWLRRPPKSKTLYNQETGVYTFVDGTRIRCLSTHQPSKAEGARVQGFSWSWCGSDELQDHLDKNADIELRGRKAPGGVYYRFATATAKDSPAWRTFRDRQLLARNRVTGEMMWSRADLLGRRSPFVMPSFWDDIEATTSKREYERRVLAKDVGPERQTYVTWDRSLNLQPVPNIGAKDVTAEVLKSWAPPGRRLDVLVGFDPGKLFDVSVLLKAYRFHGADRHVWYVVGEVTTEQSTTETHVDALLKRLREMNVNEPRLGDRGGLALVRADPYSDSGIAQDRPDRSVYTIFRKAGLLIHPATYATTTKAVKPGTVPREGGINMVCGLLCSASEDRRLFVACDDRREPVAPRLVEAFETSERDELGKAEQERKDYKDQSHWPAALRYALWVLEKPRMYEAA